MTAIRASRILLSLLVVGLLCWQPACDPNDPGPDGDADGDVDGDADTDADGDGGCPADWACCENQECSDGIFCNGIEVCDRGVCEQDPNAYCTPGGGCVLNCDDSFECTVDECDEQANTCVHQPSHEFCLDEDLCNGEERCAPADGDADDRGCILGLPLICDDGDNCTDDYCEENECLARLRDADGDGHGDDDCVVCVDPEIPDTCERGDDCNDANDTVYPGAEELCDDGEDNNCDRIRDYADPLCVLPNDTCADAMLLTRGDTINSSTRRALADIDSSCAPADQGDVAFAFNVPSVQDVEITVETRGARTVNVALTADCGAPEADIKCTSGRSFTQITRALGAGTYYVIVSAPLEADFAITFDHSDPVERPEGDQCTSAVDATGGGTFEGTTEGFDPDYTTSCGEDTDRDATFVFSIDDASALDIEVTGTGPVAVAVQSACGVPSSELGCFEREPVGGRIGSLLPGTYYVIVKSAAEVDFTLDLEFSMTSSDTCGAVRTISPDSTYFGTTLGMAADIETACGDPTGPDGAYRFELTEEQDVTIDFRSAGEEMTLSLTDACGDPDGEVRCSSGRTFQVRGRGLPRGSYYLVATGTAGADFEFDISSRDPVPRPADDLCSGAISISGDGTYDGDTTDCENDYESRCGSADDVDTAYVFTLREARSMDLTVEADSGPITVAIQPDCGVVGTERSCFTSDADGSAHRYYRSLDAGTYYLVFKTPLPDTFSFDIEFGEAEPTVILPWIDPAGHTRFATSPGDDGQYNAEIAPLTFPFNGETYGCVAISTNGYLRFGPAGSCPTARGYSDSYTDIDLVYPAGTAQVTWLGDDGYMGSNVYSYVDTAENRIVITYLGHHRLGRTGLNNVQIILFCDSGDIQISYSDSTFDTTSYWAIGVSEPGMAGGVLQPHDFIGHESGSSVSFGPGAVYQAPEHIGSAAYLPINDRAIFFQRSGSGWDVVVDELPL